MTNIGAYTPFETLAAALPFSVKGGEKTHLSTKNKGGSTLQNNKPEH